MCGRVFAAIRYWCAGSKGNGRTRGWVKRLRDVAMLETREEWMATRVSAAEWGVKSSYVCVRVLFVQLRARLAQQTGLERALAHFGLAGRRFECNPSAMTTY